MVSGCCQQHAPYWAEQMEDPLQKSATMPLPSSSLLRLQRRFTLELILLARGVRSATRFERADGCFGAFGLDSAHSILEFRVDPYTGAILEVSHDAASWSEVAIHTLPV